MKRKHGVFFGITVLLMAVMFTMTGCNNGNSGDGDGGDENNGGGGGAFSVSGSFNKSEAAGSGEVKFEVKSNDAFGRAVSADSYTISGALEDGDLTIRLKGSYDPNAGNWSVSAKSSSIIYTINGNVNSAGVSQGSSATIAVKSGEEWIPFIFPIRESAVNIPGTAKEGIAGVLPSFA
jgi:hypothetical protein